MKRIVSILLVLLLIFGLCGCKDNKEAISDSSDYEEVIYVYDEESSESETSENAPTQSTQTPTQSSVPTQSSQVSTPSASTVKTGRNTHAKLGAATVANGIIPVTDGHLYFSPYSWYNGGNYRLNTVGGGYVKVAFTGNLLALGVDISKLGDVPPAHLIVHAYIDSEKKYVAKTLADAVNGVITFADNLSAGTHYATIYLSKTDTEDAWYGEPKSALRVTGIHIAAGQQVLDLHDTPIAVKNRRVVFYGDSITEGAGLSGAELSFAPKLANLVGAEYGQNGNGGIGWFLGGARGLDQFYYADSVKRGYWRYYYQNTPRFIDDNPSKGYIDGAPDAVFLNMGENDEDKNHQIPADDVKKALTSWLSDARASVAPDTKIFVIVPFNFNSAATQYQRFKMALTSGFDEYIKANPNDKNTYLLDLGKDGFDMVKNNSTDRLHPDAFAAEQLAIMLSKQVEQYW